MLDAPALHPGGEGHDLGSALQPHVQPAHRKDFAVAWQPRFLRDNRAAITGASVLASVVVFCFLVASGGGGGIAAAGATGYGESLGGAAETAYELPAGQLSGCGVEPPANPGETVHLTLTYNGVQRTMFLVVPAKCACAAVLQYCLALLALLLLCGCSPAAAAAAAAALTQLRCECTEPGGARVPRLRRQRRQHGAVVAGACRPAAGGVRRAGRAGSATNAQRHSFPRLSSCIHGVNNVTKHAARCRTQGRASRGAGTAPAPTAAPRSGQAPR